MAYDKSQKPHKRKKVCQMVGTLLNVFVNRN